MGYMPRQAKTTSSKRRDALKKPFRLNSRAISTVLATVFFLGIAISVAVTLFLMSSTYNNLYQQQLQVREDRLRESVFLNRAWLWNDTSLDPKGVIKMRFSVTNKGSVTAHVVNAYHDDQLLNVSFSIWISPASTGIWDVAPIGEEWWQDLKVNDKMMVSTDRGTTSIYRLKGQDLLRPPGGLSGATRYSINVQMMNPQSPEEGHNPHQAAIFRYMFWVIDNQSLPDWFPRDNLVPPGFDPHSPTGYNYSTPTAPEGFVGVRAGDVDRSFIVWAAELQWDTSGKLIWARVGPADLRPLAVAIPEGAETYVWVAMVWLADFPIGTLPPFSVSVTIIPSGKLNTLNMSVTEIDVKVDAVGPVGPSIYQSLIDTTVALETTGSPTASYNIIANSNGTRSNVISIESPGAADGVVLNGVTAEGFWRVQVYGAKNSSVTFQVTVSGKGSYDKLTYTAMSETIEIRVLP
jgi:hypothetical protein